MGAPSGDWTFACNCGASFVTATLNEILRLTEIHSEYCAL